jgi:hypothetical protein
LENAKLVTRLVFSSRISVRVIGGSVRCEQLPHSAIDPVSTCYSLPRRDKVHRFFENFYLAAFTRKPCT